MGRGLALQRTYNGYSKMNYDVYSLKERECPVCGKIFVPAPQHVFVEDDKVFCKWTCLCAYRKQRKSEKPKKKDARRRTYTPEQKAEAIRMTIEEGKTQKEIAEELGVNYLSVRSWVNAYRKGAGLE